MMGVYRKQRGCMRKIMQDPQGRKLHQRIWKTTYGARRVPYSRQGAHSSSQEVSENQGILPFRFGCRGYVPQLAYKYHVIKHFWNEKYYLLLLLSFVSGRNLVLETQVVTIWCFHINGGRDSLQSFLRKVGRSYCQTHSLSSFHVIQNQ